MADSDSFVKENFPGVVKYISLRATAEKKKVNGHSVVKNQAYGSKTILMKKQIILKCNILSWMLFRTERKKRTRIFSMRKTTFC